MRAVILERFGGPEVLRIHGVSDPTPGVAQVRVRIAATALNRADVLQREGRYPPPAPKPGDILGLEFSGTVDALGPGVTAWKPGDRVFGLLGEGGYAEQVVTHERMLMPMLPGMSFDDAAAIPEVYFTAYDALVDRARVEMGEAVLIHAGGSGVGTAAIQLARAMGAGRLLTTVGSDAKAWRCLDLGADRAINYRTETFEDVVMAETGGKGADVIVDFVGGPYAQRNVNAVRTMGRVILVGLLGGARGEIDMTTWFVKRVSLTATTLRARPLEQKIALTQRFIEKLLPLFGDGRLRAIVDRTFPLDQVADAHRYMEENRNFGKIVVRCQ
ncbi:MAG: NAD(P)H-quinone oxidoreductase [Armatimonadetes bacterium]|nr:NAD(P)H-quinone oxidoreductase [Armatimonadota bacterium]